MKPKYDTPTIKKLYNKFNTNYFLSSEEAKEIIDYLEKHSKGVGK